MEVERLADADAVAARTAELIVGYAGEAIRRRGVAHVALTGGTSPLRCYELLGTLQRDWGNVHFWYGDERCVPFDDPESNHGAALERLDTPGAVFHPMPGTAGPFEGASRYAAELSGTVLDLVLLGMGPDGHVASLFGGHPVLELGGVAAGIDDSPKPPLERITLTLPKLNEAHERVLIVTGAAKAEALARALGPPDRGTPASLLERSKLRVLADEAASPRPDSGV